MASSEQLEREAEAARARIAETLAELRRRVSPGQMLDEAIDYVGERNGAELVRNLGRQIADNPMPVALLGAGLAWLMFAQRRDDAAIAKKGDGPVDTTEPASLNEQADRTTVMASKCEKTSRRASRMAEDAAEEVTQAGTTVYERANKAIDRSISSAAEGTRSLMKFMQDEPMVVAGLGITLGAIIGALLPAAEIENRAMGDASGRLKKDARKATREQWERGKAIAEDGRDDAKEAARRTWDDTKREAGLADGRSDGHAGDTTGTQAPLVPSEEETKAAAKAQPSSA